MVVIPIIIGALGTWIRKIQMENYCDPLQKACLLGTAKIIRKIFDTQGCVLQLAIQDIPTI